MMTKKIETKDQIWIALFCVIPVLLLIRLSDVFAHSSLERVLYSGLFGGIGGLVGTGVLQLVKTRSTIIKIASVVLLTGICATVVVATTKLSKPTLQTCEVCGYRAVEKLSCEYCGSPTWEKQKEIRGYNDKQEWLREEQLFWFSLDSATQKVDFYSSDSSEEFEKDKNWKPVITEQELIDDFGNN